MVGWLRSYDRRWLRGDLIAGVAVAALIVPKNLGYAGIAGVPLQNGLYAAAAGAILYPIFGTSRQISTGPSSGLAAVAAERRRRGRGHRGPGRGVLRGDDHARLRRAVPGARGVQDGMDRAVPLAAVVTGFLFGAAIDVVIGELPKLTGTEVTGSNPLQELRSWFGTLGDANRATVVVGGASLVVVFGLRVVAPRVPGALVLVVGGLVTSWLLDLGAHGVALVGEVPRGSADASSSPTCGCSGIMRARSRSRRWRSSSSGSRRPPATPGRSRPSTAIASTSTRNRSPRAWRTSAPACSRACRSRRACPPVR